MDAGPVLADDPPLAIAMPSKPVFFDIAWQYIVDTHVAASTVDEYLERHKEQPANSSRGFLGWLRGS